MEEDKRDDKDADSAEEGDEEPVRRPPLGGRFIRKPKKEEVEVEEGVEGAREAGPVVKQTQRPDPMATMTAGPTAPAQEEEEADIFKPKARP